MTLALASSVVILMLSSLLVVGVIDVGLCGDHSSLTFVVVVGDAVQVLVMVVDRH